MDPPPLTTEEQVRQLKKELQQHQQELQQHQHEWHQYKPKLDQLIALEEDLKALITELERAQKFARERSSSSSNASPKTPHTVQAMAAPQKMPSPPPRPPVATPEKIEPKQLTADGQYALHIASFKHRHRILEGWRALQQKLPTLLGTYQPRLKSVNLGANRGVYYRLKVGPFVDAQSANTLCQQLKSRNNDCVLSKFDGEPLETMAKTETKAGSTPNTPTQSNAEQTQPAQAASQGNPELPAFALRLSSYKKQSSLKAGWRLLKKQFPQLLGQLSPRTTSIDLGAGRGVFYRLSAGPITQRQEAVRLCEQLKAQNAGCAVTAFEGAPVE